MKTLLPDSGIPRPLMWMLAVMAGISVANLYYCQPLLNLIRDDMGVSEFEVNLIPVLTQVGYAVGLFLIIPMGDIYRRRTTVLTCMCLLVLSLISISLSTDIRMILISSFVTGVCSVTPQVFIPVVSRYSRPQDKDNSVGMVLSGILTGILMSRVISGYIGHVLGWREMFLIAAALISICIFVFLKFFPETEVTYKGRFLSLLSSIGRLVSEHRAALFYSVRSAFCFGSFLGLWACLAFRMSEPPFFVGSNVVGMLGLCGMAGALTASNVGKYIPRLGLERINAIGVLLQILAWILMYLFDGTYSGLIAGIIIIDIGMQCVQLSNQSATMRLCQEAASRMNTIYMVTYFVGGSLGTFLAGTMWTLMGWTGTVLSGLIMDMGALAVVLLGIAFLPGSNNRK